VLAVHPPLAELLTPTAPQSYYIIVMIGRECPHGRVIRGGERGVPGRHTRPGGEHSRARPAELTSPTLNRQKRSLN
jgi:hypothetical protein